MSAGRRFFLAGLTLATSCVAALAFATIPEDPIQEAKDHVPPCLIHDTGPPLHSPGQSMYPDERFPCWVRSAGPGLVYELVVGNATAAYADTAPKRVPWADAFFDDETDDCGWNDAAGTTFGPSATLRLRLGGLSFIDGATTDGGYADARLQYANVPNCAYHPSYGPAAILGGLTTSMASEMDWVMDAPGTSYVDIPFPSGGGTKYYNYKITTKTCDADGTSNCVTSADTGCFSVNWTYL